MVLNERYSGGLRPRYYTLTPPGSVAARVAALRHALRSSLGSYPPFEDIADRQE